LALTANNSSASENNSTSANNIFEKVEYGVTSSSIEEENQFLDAVIGDTSSGSNSIMQDGGDNNNNMVTIINKDGMSKKIQKNSLRGKLTERRVGEVVELLRKWRYLYHTEGHTLKMASMKVGIPKKSLDDYLRICKVAKMGGFDFEARANEKIGSVRAFVRKHQDQINEVN